MCNLKLLNHKISYVKFENNLCDNQQLILKNKILHNVIYKQNYILKEFFN